MKYSLASCSLLLFVASSLTANAQQNPIYKNNAFAIYPDSVVQANFVAKALSATQINSNYQSPANEYQSPAIIFKFSVNRKDNEMRPGINHQFNCIAPAGGNCTTPIIKFGTPFIDGGKIPDKTYLSANSNFTIRVDMREVIAAFKKDGYFTTFNGDKIYAADFKGLYVAGPSEPMTWDFDNLYQRPQLELKDADADGIYETTMVLNETKKEKDLAADWQLTKDISAFPQYQSDYKLSDALYNMALEEMQNAIEPDSTFRTGKEWAGVWTRDISYSILLSMAYLQPAVAKYSLLKKVKNGRIIQDTGTGGAYPNSTDRIIWAVAAWELYKATGDRDWLSQSYTIIKNSIDDDISNAHDKITGLVRGESSFLDWREQTYPKWMQPADIFESECLGTNAAHYKANLVLSEMAGLLNKKYDAEKYAQVAQQIKNGINKFLWIPAKGYYGQFLYGNNFKILSPKSEALGEALTVIFGIAGEKQRAIIARTPVTNFGIPCIFPQIKNIPAYHNNAVWPFVQSFWAQAAAKAGNETSVLESIAAIYRPAALFLTNKENFVVDNGDYKGTQINSSNMLWSLAGNISLVHKILFGIEFKADGLSFNPFVPFNLAGKRRLSNFHYRNSILNIELEGYGNQISSFTLDGELKTSPFIPSTLEGVHAIIIKLANNKPGGKTKGVDNHVAPETPVAELKNNRLSWQTVKTAIVYKIIKNGILLLTTEKNELPVINSGYAAYQVIAVDDKGYESFASMPLVITDKRKIIKTELETIISKDDFPYKGFSGEGFIEISKQKNSILNISVDLKEDGIYAIDFRYANGNGPTNTENKCAIRTLKEDKDIIGTIIFPQRGVDEWSNWGFSNSVQTNLKKGKHIITLSLESANENMNGDINQAMLDYMRVIKIK